MAVIQIDEEQFEEVVLNSDIPVVVDFWANWCGPCKMLSPIVDQVAEEVTTTKFIGVDVDNAERLAVKYGISSIPCLILFKNGEEADRVVGAVPKQKLEQVVSA